MPKFYRNPEQYANEIATKIEKKVDELNERIVRAEQMVQSLKLELLELQNNCPHIITFDNDRPTADERATKTCRACGFTD